jgi:hypothetical protein
MRQFAKGRPEAFGPRHARYASLIYGVAARTMSHFVVAAGWLGRPRHAGFRGLSLPAGGPYWAPAK